ncbi:hypothetical protein BZA05DRAFT_330959 [Tricharina praecox]|uniref:uncharacterized protein n=1 Tax=Tricharina praecox TaxID=43433 RepID=UPI00221E3D56|nr:uncharacterized protein BZA05DRAFT_330959 [Tricharina praecox]KAI5857872.1 hypothetical protein BZA05DRAFT_330959 [Tricharina praecox]
MHNASVSSTTSTTSTTSSSSSTHRPHRRPPRPSRLPPLLTSLLARTHHIIFTRFSLILVLLFISTVLVVGTSLYHMTGASSRLLEANNKLFAGEERLWRRFPKLKKYYAGLYTQVMDKWNVPEFPPRRGGIGGGGGGGDGGEGGGGRGELAATKKSRVFEPYPAYESKSYQEVWEGAYVQCSFGEGRARPEVRVFEGVPEGMPEPAFGSHQVLGLQSDVCFDRYGRLGSYGYGYMPDEGGLGVAVFNGGEREKTVETAHGVGGFPLRKVDWRGVDWRMLQDECGELNKARFKDAKEGGKLTIELKPQNRKRDGKQKKKKKKKKKKLPRNAVLLRTYTGYKYTLNDVANLRSLISELSLLSGGEYTVHILLHVRNKRLEIWDDPNVYRETLTKSGLPREFWNLTELWNEPLMEQIYARVPDTSANWRGATLPDDKGFLRLPQHGVYRSTFMPVQWFSQRHSQYDFVWNWEMDIRYTGHWYHLFSQLDLWTEKQPRRGLWERNSRFYVPAVHGDWDEFVASTAAITNNTIFGPVPVEGVTPILPNPPMGEGEPADLITFNPLFDPHGTTWILRDDTTGYPADPPRRAAIITASRLSRRLLTAMHKENVENGRAMFSEMFPATAALHHGLKAVFAPHPVYMDRRWPVGFMEKMFNDGVDGFTGGRKESVFGKREHNFRGGTWYYNAHFPAELYKAWVTGSKGKEGEIDRLERGGRMCLKAMLLHPIKS